MTDKFNITKIEIKRLTYLARLSISDNEAEKYAKQLDEIVNYVSKLDKVDLSEIEPLYHVLDQTISGRKDKIKKGLEFSKLLENAPDYKGKLFKVPPVIIGKKQSK